MNGGAPAPSFQALSAAAPGLTIGGPFAFEPTPPATGALDAASDRFAVEGWMRWPNCVDSKALPILADGVNGLCAAGHHPVWIWMFDETWRLAAGLEPLFARFLGDDPMMLPHLWAWRIEGEDQAGWPAHRDWSAQARFGEVLAGLSVWIPFVDIGRDEGGIGLLPQDRDYGGDAPDPRAVRLLDAAAGDALCWRPDLLHWGCRPTRFARHPRISIAIEAQSAAFAPFAEPLTSFRAPPEPERRAAMIAKRWADYRRMDAA